MLQPSSRRQLSACSRLVEFSFAITAAAGAESGVAVDCFGREGR
jgi:hypothetical protein